MTVGKVLAFGECMAELDIHSSCDAKIQFSGDVYNSLVYAKRWNAALPTLFASAVGHDKLSQLLLKDAESNNIECSLVLKTHGHNLGMYTISTDEHGESSFDYWRANSAATRFFELLKHEHVESLKTQASKNSIFYFTGISIAIFRGSDKDKFLMFVNKLKDAGFTIAFDSNYRASLWDSQDHARGYFEKCYALADIILPGLEDHQGVFGHHNLQTMLDYFEPLKNKEIVIKAGKEGMLGIAQDGTHHSLARKSAKKQVDATAAGDAFAGIYLAARLSGKDILASMQDAADVARLVVMHKGAIVPEQVFEEFLRNRSE